MKRFGRAIVLATALATSAIPSESPGTVTDPDLVLEIPLDTRLDLFGEMRLIMGLTVISALANFGLTDETARNRICNPNTPHIDPRIPERDPRPHPFMDDRALELMIRMIVRKKCEENLGSGGWILLRDY